jgi:chorismate mutase
VAQVRALRGATTVERDDPREIERATRALLEEMLARNGIGTDQLISVIFTATADLVADFPAAAARALGIADVPLLCSSEIPVTGALPRCVRVLMHFHSDLGRSELKHVYLAGAAALRADLR